MADIRITVADDDENVFSVHPGADTVLQFQTNTDDLLIEIADGQILELIKVLLIYQFKPFDGTTDEEFLEKAIAMLESFGVEAERAIADKPTPKTVKGRVVQIKVRGPIVFDNDY